MGFRFKPNEDTITLAFAEGHELHGLEIVTRKRMPVGLFIEAERDIFKAIGIFCDQIVSWNAEDDAGNPIAASTESIGAVLGMDQIGEVLDAWKLAIARPAAPLGPQSSGSDS